MRQTGINTGVRCLKVFSGFLYSQLVSCTAFHSLAKLANGNDCRARTTRSQCTILEWFRRNILALCVATTTIRLRLNRKTTISIWFFLFSYRIESNRMKERPNRATVLTTMTTTTTKTTMKITTPSNDSQQWANDDDNDEDDDGGKRKKKLSKWEINASIILSPLNGSLFALFYLYISVSMRYRSINKAAIAKHWQRSVAKMLRMTLIKKLWKSSVHEIVKRVHNYGVADSENIASKTERASLIKRQWAIHIREAANVRALSHCQRHTHTTTTLTAAVRWEN